MAREKITRDMVEDGWAAGIVRLGLEPYSTTGVVCWIGDNYFFFTDDTDAELMTPEEYIAEIDVNVIIDEICDGLEAIEEVDDDEYMYYFYVLNGD